MQDTPHVACSLTKSRMSERQRRWHDLADRAFAARVVTDRGLRLEFRASAGVEDELRELALLERDCCRFAEWHVTGDGKLAALDVTGIGDEAVGAVQQMFRTLSSAQRR
jgi:hypothetical protein